MANHLLIAIEIAMSMRFFALVFPIVVKTVNSTMWHLMPFLMILPVHVSLVSITPLLGFYDCIFLHGTKEIPMCVETSQVINTPYELINPETFRKNLDLIHFSMNLFHGGTSFVIQNAFTAITAMSAKARADHQLLISSNLSTDSDSAGGDPAGRMRL